MNTDTSWQSDAKHYDSIVGDRGHYYHQTIVIPGAIRLARLQDGMSVLDLGCGQGVLARAIGDVDVHYTGVDASKFLIDRAKKTLDKRFEFVFGDATKIRFTQENYDVCFMILSLQNMEYPEKAIATAAWHLGSGGKLVLILNHPCFRIPRQSGWGEHENKLQYRYVNRYMSDLKIPITMHPGKGQQSGVTWSFHKPLSSYVEDMKQVGLLVESIEEWTSDKMSQGKAAKMENRAREEIPLFMAIVARKQ